MASDAGADAALVIGGVLALAAAIGLMGFEKRIVLAVADGYFAIAQRTPRWLLPQPWLAAARCRGQIGLIGLVRVIAWTGRGGSVLLGSCGVVMLLIGTDAIT